MGAEQVTPMCAYWHHSGQRPQFAVKEGEGGGGSPQWRCQIGLCRLPRLPGSNRSRTLTSVCASAQSSWELALSTVSPLGHPRLLLMSTVRSEPSIPDRSNLAFSPQSVQYMNLGKEEHQLVIPAVPEYQYVNTVKSILHAKKGVVV